jgi:hypothetical protein
VYFPLHMSLCNNYIFGVITIFGLSRRDVLVGRVDWVQTGGGGKFFRPNLEDNSLLCSEYQGSFPGVKYHSHVMGVTRTYVTDERKKSFSSTDSLGMKS